MAYAEATTVPFERSISEIIGMVRDRGAQRIAQMEDAGTFTIAFNLDERLIRFKLPLASMSKIPTHNGRNQALTAQQRNDRLKQVHRSQARALMLVIKAKFESIDSGIETTEQAFLANVVMSDGQTVYERINVPVALEYESGRIGQGAWLLPPPAGAK